MRIIINYILCTSILLSRSIFHQFYSTIFLPFSFLFAKAKKGGFIDYAIPNIVYVFVSPSQPTFFLLVAKIERIFVTPLHKKLCNEYYLFRERTYVGFFYKLISRLLRSLDIKMVLSPCRTCTYVSKLVCSETQLVSKETRVSNHPRSTRLRKLGKSISNWNMNSISHRKFGRKNYKSKGYITTELGIRKVTNTRCLYKTYVFMGNITTKKPRFSLKKSKRKLKFQLYSIRKKYNE